MLSARYRTATWMLSAYVTTADTGAALREIFAEIRKLRAEPPPVEELERVKRYAGGTFVLGLSTRGALGDRLAWMNFHGLPRAYLDSFVQRVYAVTPEQVSALVRRYLPADRMTLVVVGDLAKVRPQLADLADLKEAEFQ
jgi:predicted Zn-dependent peptidase